LKASTDAIAANNSTSTTNQISNDSKYNNSTKSTEPIKNKVLKSYRDYAHLSDEEALETFSTKSSRNRVVDSFPVKLHSIIERSDEDGYSSIIEWLWHGRAFKIHNQSIFLAKVMPMFFYQTKMSSFIRQLSTYGFHKIIGEENADKDCFYHELFLRGRPTLAGMINRQKKRCLIDPKNEPDLSKFYPLTSSLVALEKAGMNTEESDQDDARPRTIQYSYNKSITNKKDPPSVETKFVKFYGSMRQDDGKILHMQKKLHASSLHHQSKAIVKPTSGNKKVESIYEI